MAQPAKSKSKFRPKREKPEFDQHILDLARVTRVTKGGKQLSFRATVIIGDRKGQVGYGIDKGKDVQIAVEKAVNQAKKNMIRVPIVEETVPHRVEAKFKAGRVMIKPAPRGSGIIAGSALRTVLDLAGIPNASGKILGRTNNKLTNVKAAFEALQMFKPVRHRTQEMKTLEVKKEAQKEAQKPEKKRAAKKTQTAPAKEALTKGENT